ncbi:MAG: hypothetical protein IJ883_06620 [Eubacterium sp.]|nr:hypothetical protein [Eubacterium sp.]
MVWFNIVGLIILLSILLITCRYKSKYVKKLDSKKHRLKILYPASLWITDKLPRKLISRNTKTNRKLKELYLKEDIGEEQNLYVAQKISIVIIVLFCGLVFGLGLVLPVLKHYRKLAKSKEKITLQYIHL